MINACESSKYGLRERLQKLLAFGYLLVFAQNATLEAASIEHLLLSGCVRTDGQ
jgi:hypothetical protein